MRSIAVARIILAATVPLLLPIVGEPVGNSSAVFTAHISAILCSIDRTEPPLTAEAQRPLAGLLNHEETSLRPLRDSVQNGIAEIDLELPAGHHYIDLRTAHCATDVPVMLGQDYATSFSAALKQGYEGYLDWPRDAWIRGCMPITGAVAVVVSPATDRYDVRFVGRVSGRCYLIGPLSYERYLLSVILSDGRRTEGVPVDWSRGTHVTMDLTIEQMSRFQD